MADSVQRDNVFYLDKFFSPLYLGDVYTDPNTNKTYIFVEMVDTCYKYLLEDILDYDQEEEGESGGGSDGDGAA